MLVRKRDGRIVEFDEDKILESIKKAALAVEGKDDDIQERARQIKNIKKALIDSGFDPDEAEDQAEQQFEGYIENGEYTEYDEDEALEVLDVVVESLDALDQDIIDTSDIQDFVEKALMMTDHSSTAREYIIHRSNRERIREMNTSLMRSFENLTFGNSKDIETKRENANIDGDSSMGTMLKYGSEGAKKFNLLHLVPPKESKAHSNGDIHIHDLDFMALTETCISKDMRLEVTYPDEYGDINGNWSHPTASEFLDKFLENLPDDYVYRFKDDEIYYISSSDISGTDVVRIVNCVRHPIGNKKMLRITCSKGSIEVTSDHRVSVTKRELLEANEDAFENLLDSYGDNWFDDIKASELRIGDELVHTCSLNFPGVGLTITSIEEIDYDGYVYDMETEDHHFTINGFVVHNCCQIDLERLFKGGFNTGHGFLREPGEIRSYGALACIAIQSNQNDQHGGQSVPNFDYYMAPGVAKTFIKELHKVLVIRYPEKSDKIDEIRDELRVIRQEDESGLILNHMDEIKSLINSKFNGELTIRQIDSAIDVALKYTKDATHQAMEAVVHNLNSMHCLPYDEQLWVLDVKTHKFEPMEIGKLAENFEPNRFEVVSLNIETGKAEFKFVTAAKDMGANRDIVKLVNNQGATVRVTDNHRIMTIRDNQIVADYPDKITHTITPRFIKTPPVNNDICIEEYGRVYKDTPYQENHISVSEAFAELMGYYIADGSLLGDTGTLCFTTCGKVPLNEMKDLVSEVFKTKLNGFVTYYDNYEKGESEKDIRFGVEVRVARMIADKFGKGSHDKKIPIEIMFAPDNIKEAFIKAYFRCDGRKDANYSEVNSVNKNLINQIAFMIQSLGGSVHYNNSLSKECEMHSIYLSGYDSVMVGIKDVDNTAFSIPKYDLSMLGINTQRASGNLRYEELEEVVCCGASRYEKFLNMYFNECKVTERTNSGDTHVYDISVEDNETFLTCEGIYVHNSRAGAQVPFSSLNFGTDTSEEGRMVSFALLKATEEGLGNGETPIFPISIWKMKSGVNYNKEDPNYDLFKESIRVSAKRLFPNFSNLDAPYNLAYYKEGDKDTEVAYMGCVQGSEVVTYRFNGKLYVESIKRMYERVSGTNLGEVNKTAFVDTSNMDVEIFDSNSKKFVKNIKVIVNPNKNNWKLIKMSDGRSLVATEDHPLPILNRGRTFVRDIKVGDKVPVTYNQYSEESITPHFSTDVAWLLGLILCDASYANNVMISIGPDETDILSKIENAAKELGFSITAKEQHRGVKGDYIDVNIKCGSKLKSFREYLECEFGGKQKMLRQIPNEVFSWSMEFKEAFFAGMMDADGYINHHRDRDDSIDTSRFSIGSVNKELALQQVALAQALGFSAKYYRNKYSSNKVRYLVECPVIPGVVRFMASNKKITIAEIRSSHIRAPQFAEIISIEDIDMDEPSFDVETESDRFDVSGILSHNCRTRVIGNVYDPSYEKVTGRGNLSFTSINLPRLGIKAHGDIDKFFKYLDEMLELVHHQLLHRFSIQCMKHPRNYPFLMGQGVWKGSDKLGPDDNISEILKHGTLTVGFIGLAECLIALTGKHHGESEESQELGLKIIQHMRDMTDKWSREEKLNYSVIATPAEGLSGRFVRIDKKKYGIIPGVTDKEYYTNSFHVPVYFPISAYKKIKLEAPYHALCNGGHISYIELDGDPSKNLEAFEKIVRYMHDAGIGYGAINHPVDSDPICGYVGIIDEVCPRCGRRDGEPMTEEMWQKIKGYPSWANADHLGVCGNCDEEFFRIPNSLDE